MNYSSLAIGITIGVAVTIGVVFFMQLENSNAAEETPQDEGYSIYSFTPGLLKEIRNDTMIIDQTFGNPEYTDNPALQVQLTPTTAFYDCVVGDRPLCGGMERSEVENNPAFENVDVCVTGSIRDNTVSGGKIFLHTSCAWQGTQ